jgi:hypothetical protein
MTFSKRDVKQILRRSGAKPPGDAAAAFSEDELREYYQAHPEEFAGPAGALRFVVRRFQPDAPADFVKEQARSVRENPAQMDAAKAGPWVSREDLASKFTADQIERLFAIPDGGVSDVLEDREGTRVLVRVIGKKAGEPKPFEQVREDVRKRLAHVRASRQASGNPDASGTPAGGAGYVHQGPLKDLVAKVGPGGVPRSLRPLGLLPSRDFGFHLKRIAVKSGKDAGALGPAERRQALDAAIRDELLFQGALADGILGDDYCRTRVIEAFKSHETKSGFDTRDKSLEEIGAEVKRREEQLMAKVRGTHPGLPDEEALFRSALEAGAAREAQVYLRIINTWLDRRKLPADPEKAPPELIEELKRRFPVEVVE